MLTKGARPPVALRGKPWVVHPVILAESIQETLVDEVHCGVTGGKLGLIAVSLSDQTALSSLTVVRVSQPRERLAPSVPKV